jgi:biotin-(acetyl-CoA carboxylase) ligase
VTLPGGEALQGLAAALDDDGRLAVEDPAGAHHTVAAGDVVHATHA